MLKEKAGVIAGQIWEALNGKEKGMTQKELSQRTGIRPPTISAICTGAIKEIPVGVLEKICSALNCSVSDIVEFETEK